jgi:hypothetical protein
VEEVDTIETATYWNIPRPIGVGYTVKKELGVIMTKDSIEMTTFTWRGIGRTSSLGG